MNSSKIIQVNKKSEHGIVALFARESDEMIIGSAYLGESRFGEDGATVEIRHFASNEKAIEYVKQKCRDYLGRQDVDFLVRNEDEDSHIVSPRSRLM